MDAVDAEPDERVFQVLAWPSDRRIVLYVPEIEATTTVSGLSDADDAVCSLITDLTGLAAGAFRCEITLGRPR